MTQKRLELLELRKNHLLKIREDAAETKAFDDENIADRSFEDLLTEKLKEAKDETGERDRAWHKIYKRQVAAELSREFAINSAKLEVENEETLNTPLYLNAKSGKLAEKTQALLELKQEKLRVEYDFRSYVCPPDDLDTFGGVEEEAADCFHEREREYYNDESELNAAIILAKLELDIELDTEILST